MLDAIKHITGDNFFSHEDNALSENVIFAFPHFDK